MTGGGLEPTFGINEMSRAVPDRRVGATTSVGRTLCQPNTFAASMARNVAIAPARRGGRALRGGACGTLIPRMGSRHQRPLQAQSPLTLTPPTLPAYAGQARRTVPDRPSRRGRWAEYRQPAADPRYPGPPP